MKRRHLLAIFATFTLLLTACGQADNTTSADISETIAIETTTTISETETETEVTTEETTLPLTTIGEETVTSFVCDDSYDVISFCTDDTKSYTFTHSGDDDASWMIYLLSEEFNDGYRYLYSNYEPYAESNCTIEIEKGTYVYCICSQNQWNTEVPPDSVLTITD